MLRRAVWRHLARAFTSGQRVLDLGCGTGEDAIWLAGRGLRVTAVDGSAAMLRTARSKAEAAGVAERIAFAQLELNHFKGAAAAGLPAAAGPYDGALSNFGVLNCVRDRRALAAALAQLVRPGGQLILVVMGPICWWEIAWFLLHGQPRRAFRRWQSHPAARLAAGAELAVAYPSPRRLGRELTPWFQRRRLAALGLLLPPSYLAQMVDRRPAAFERAAALERRLETLFPFPWLGDHYILQLERSGPAPV
jgi:SAM-dependent methyltransferase